MQGRFDDAERLARDALAAAEAAGNWNGITASRVQLAWCWKDVGRGAERAAEVERFVRDEVLTRPLSRGAAAMWNGNLALFMAEAGLEERAREYLARLGACEDAAAHAERRRAQRRRARRRGVRAAAETNSSRGGSTSCSCRATACASSAAAASISEARRRATSASSLRRSAAAATAIRHHEDALLTNTRAQAPPWIARSRLDLARALLARGGPGDEQRAVDLLGDAEPLARGLGMRSVAAQAVRARSAISA